MADLKKWFPFKFKRKDKDKTSAAATATTAPVPYNPAQQMQRMMQGLMTDRFWQDPFSLLDQADSFFGNFAPTAFRPTIDVVDEGDHITVTAELPGMDKADLQLSVHDGVLTVAGEKRMVDESKEEGCYRTERYYGQFSRAVPLPAGVAEDRAEAAFDKGVLTVRFPKDAQTQARRIPL